MNTKQPDELDKIREEILAREPNPQRISRGPAARERRRREAAKTRITIRIDEDIITSFKAMTKGQGYQSLINNALREWLLANDIKEIVRNEMQELVKETVVATLSSLQSSVQAKSP